MMKVLVYCDNRQAYLSEFYRRFGGKFNYYVNPNSIRWNDVMITFVSIEPRGYLADIAIGFNQTGIDIITRRSCINIKEKRSTTYFDLLDCINDNGTFNWQVYLSKENNIYNF